MIRTREKIALAIPTKYRHLFHKVECALGLHRKVISQVSERVFCLLCEKDLS